MTNTAIALVGAGLVGKRHLLAMQQADNVSLAAIVDPDPAAADSAKQHGVPWHASLADLFTHNSADGILLATPTNQHVEQGLQALDAGCPMLIEKPIAIQSADAEALVTASEVKGVPILVGHHRRYNPLIDHAHELIASGQLGDIRAVQATCWLYKPDDYFAVAEWRKRPGAGPVSVNLVHDVDLIRYLCGEVVRVQAQWQPSARGFDNEDVASAILVLDSGAIVTISVADSIAAPWSWELTARENPAYPITHQSCYLIGGSDASLSIPDMQLWEHTGKKSWWSPISATTAPHSLADPLVNQLEHFADVIQTGRAPRVSGREGLKSLRVIEAIEIAAASGDTVSL